MAHKSLKAANGEIFDLKKRNRELENQLASGVHTCSNQCQRPMCVLRRENQELEAKAERLEKALTPSPETKAAYWGSDELECTDWTLIKEIMSLILKQAALEGKQE